MNEEHPEYIHRVRVLTDDDIEAISELLAANHHCKFSEEEQVDIRRYIKRLNSIANAIGWVVLGLIGAGILYFLKLGIIAKGN
jgi:hypothetical protein